MITFDPYIPMAMWTALAAVGTALIAVYAVASRGRLVGTRRFGSLALMAVAIALPLVILLNPTWIEYLPPPAGKPVLNILVDRSASMATEDVDGESRFVAARRIASNMLELLSNRFEVGVRPFDVHSGAVSGSSSALDNLSPDGESTDLATAIEDSLQDAPQGQAILLLSDGIHNGAGGADRLRRSIATAQAMAAPVYAAALGGSTSVRDLEISLDRTQEMAFVNQEVTVVATLRQRGVLADNTQLSLLCDGQVVERRQVNLAANGSVQEMFQLKQDKTGLYRYELVADALDGEVTAVNNAATILLRVVDEPVRVLLVEGKPYWDTKFLVRTLASDPSVELTSVVRMAENRFLQRRIRPARDAESSDGSKNELKDRISADVTSGPSHEKDTTGDAVTGDAAVTNPAGSTPPDSTSGESTRSQQWKIYTDAREVLGEADTLASYRILVVGRDAEQFLTDEVVVAIKRWLSENEGALVCFRGPPSSQVGQRLGELMPVRWSPTSESRFRVHLTESGQAMHWLPAGQADTLGQLPSLSAVNQPAGAKPLAVVLARGTSQNEDPVISYQPVGSGRVVVVEGAGMWRWAFLPPQHQQHDQIYGRLWRSLLRWLVTSGGLLPSEQVSLRSDKVIFSTMEPCTATLLLRQTALGTEPPQVELMSDVLEEPQRLVSVPEGASPGQFRVPFGTLPEGRYQARVVSFEELDSANTAFDVRGNLTERLDVAAREDVLKLIAEQSGGAFIQGDQPDELAVAFENRLSASRPRRTRLTEAWDRWWVLVGVLVFWSGSWALRRRSGLI